MPTKPIKRVWDHITVVHILIHAWLASHKAAGQARVRIPHNAVGLARDVSLVPSGEGVERIDYTRRAVEGVLHDRVVLHTASRAWVRQCKYSVPYMCT